MTGHSGSVECLAWKLVGDDAGFILASGSADGSIKLWDIRKQKCIFTIPKAHNGEEINCLAFNPHMNDDTTSYQLLSGAEDGTIIVWDTKELFDNPEISKIAIFKSHKDAVSSLCWDPFVDTQFISASYDDTICVWDLALEKADC